MGSVDPDQIDRSLHCLTFRFDLLDLIVYGVRVFGHFTVFDETLKKGKKILHLVV